MGGADLKELEVDASMRDGEGGMEMGRDGMG